MQYVYFQSIFRTTGLLPISFFVIGARPLNVEIAVPEIDPGPYHIVYWLFSDTAGIPDSTFRILLGDLGICPVWGLCLGMVWVVGMAFFYLALPESYCGPVCRVMSRKLFSN